MTIAISPEHAVYDLPALSSARVSADGKRILYLRTHVDRGSGKYVSHIWMCDMTGRNKTQITHADTRNVEPVWSPDGTSIAFVATREGDRSNAICLLPLNGGEARILTSHGPRPSSLSWSPDGKTIAYCLSVDPENPNETPRSPDAPAAVRVTRRIDYKQDGFGYLLVVK